MARARSRARRRDASPDPRFGVARAGSICCARSASCPTRSTPPNRRDARCATNRRASTRAPRRGQGARRSPRAIPARSCSPPTPWSPAAGASCPRRRAKPRRAPASSCCPGRRHRVLGGIARRSARRHARSAAGDHGRRFKRLTRRRDRRLSRQRRVAGQGRRLRDPGPRRRLRARDQRLLFQRRRARPPHRGEPDRRCGRLTPWRRSSLLIDGGTDAWRAAILSDGQLFDVVSVRADGAGAEGDIYLGRVVRVLPGLGGAFVEIGLDRPALLDIRKTPPREGDIVTVQLVEPATGARRRACRGASRSPDASSSCSPATSGVRCRSARGRRGARQLTKRGGLQRRAGEGLMVRSAAADVTEACCGPSSTACGRAGRRSTLAQRCVRPAGMSAPRIAGRTAAERIARAVTVGAIVADSAATRHSALRDGGARTCRPHRRQRRSAAPLFARHDIADALADLESRDGGAARPAAR